MKWRMKLRFQIGGAILSILSIALMAFRGAGPGYEGLLVLGIVLLVLGVFWKRPSPASSA